MKKLIMTTIVLLSVVTEVWGSSIHVFGTSVAAIKKVEAQVILLQKRYDSVVYEGHPLFEADAKQCATLTSLDNISLYNKTIETLNDEIEQIRQQDQGELISPEEYRMIRKLHRKLQRQLKFVLDVCE